MRPAVALVGFVLGSAAGITFSLFGVLVIYLVLRSEDPRFAAEIEPLLAHLAMFVALTAVAAATFYAELRQFAWRVTCRIALVAALGTLVAFYWPR
jgi:uncharacterized membrane protein YfcA